MTLSPPRPSPRRLLPALLPAALAGALLLPGLTAPAAPAAPVALRAVPAASTASVRALQHRLDVALGGGTATVVGAAVDVDGVGALYRRGASAALVPASTEKLFTTLAALRVLGPTATLSTQVRTAAPLVAGTLRGDLYLVGGGDPFLSGAQLDRLAAAVAAAGVHAVSGYLHLDDYRYDQVHAGPGWKPAWVPEESGPLSALAVDRNGWRTDRAYLADPSAGNTRRFQQLLVRHGVAVSAHIVRSHLPAGSRVVAATSSARLRDLVRTVDKESSNFGAEMLLKELGLRLRGTGSTAAGAAALRSALGGLGASVGTVVDGSGLSNRDRQTAPQELSVLAGAQRAGLDAQLRRALPVACVDGTLVHRMCGTAAAGRTYAKTGSLDGVRALAGWTTTADGHRVRFSFLLGGVGSASRANAAIDAAVVALASARVG